MIKIDRSTVVIPADYREIAGAERERLIAQVRQLDEQSRIHFRPEIWTDLLRYILSVFGNKCANCESELGYMEPTSIDHYRPIGSVRESPHHRGYYWMAYDWENLLYLCRVCASNKSNRFPLEDETQRAQGPHDSLALEAPLLLDPCVDDPNLHLRFNTYTGHVEPLSPRGEATIEITGLNRAQLVDTRAHLTAEMRRDLLRWSTFDDLLLQNAIAAWTSTGSPFAAFTRALLREWLTTQDREMVERVRLALGPHADGILTEDAFESSAALGGTATLVAQPVLNPRTGSIQRIEISNFKAIHSLTLDFGSGSGSPGGVGWKVFLGENGAGKSSVLEAVALVLGGEEGLTSLAVQPGSILRRPRPHARRPAEGFIKVWLSKDSEPLELRFTKDRAWFASGGEGAGTLVRGYGATRLLPKGETVPASSPQPISGRRVLRNLFDPYHPLCHVEHWLQGLEHRGFDIAARTLKDVLGVAGQELVFSRRPGEVLATGPTGVPVPLALLSRGQQSMLVLAGDIMSGIMSDRVAQGQEAVPGDFADEAGIVLLDEIDAHLHPRWKMEVVSRLRKAFRYMQFLATTHEPLCLRGLQAGEIVVMRRTGAEVAAEVVADSPAGWRVDQLLTSALFGLNSTIDPEVEVEFQEYYSLLSTPDSELTEVARARREVLRRKLQVHNKLGYTRRDQLLYEIIDDCLAREDTLASPAARLRLREETKRKVQDIWRRVNVPRENDDPNSSVPR